MSLEKKGGKVEGWWRQVAWVREVGEDDGSEMDEKENMGWDSILESTGSMELNWFKSW